MSLRVIGSPPAAAAATGLKVQQSQVSESVFWAGLIGRLRRAEPVLRTNIVQTVFR